MKAGPIKSALIDVDRATEFSGDDVDRFSEMVDLGDNYASVLVWIPALDANGVVSIYADPDQNGAIASIPVQVNTLDRDATGHFVQGTSSGAGGFAIVFDIGGIQFIRVHVAADAAADTTFYVRGC